MGGRLAVPGRAVEVKRNRTAGLRGASVAGLDISVPLTQRCSRKTPTSVAMYSYQYPHPAVTTDVVVFTIRDGELAVLLIERGCEPECGRWAIPGGFIEIDEDLETAARRELREETSVEAGELEQLYAFGRPDRDPRERVITVAYVTILRAGQTSIRAASDAADAAWFPMRKLPQLAFDHRKILAMAQDHLHARLDDCTTAIRFLPDEFTLSELKAAHEAILGAPVDKRNFRKRMLARYLIEATGTIRRGGAHRPARLYRAK